MDIESSTTNIEMSVLSPIHIGTGEGYSMSEFCFDDIGFKNPNPKNKNDKIIYLEKLSKLNINKVSEIILNYGTEKDYKKFIRTLKHSSSMENFLEETYKESDPKIYKKIIKSKLYWSHYKCGKKGLSKVKNAESIKECVKTINIPFIPGSSIKGSIRNAILYDNIRIKSNINSIYKDVTYQNKRLNDLMKYIHFSDAYCINQLHPTIYKTKSINTNKRTTSYLETINSNSMFEFKFSNTSLYKINRNAYSFNIEKIFNNLYNFYKDVVDYELDFAYKNDLFEFEEFYINLKEMNSKDSPIIRLGGGSGALSVSQLLKIKHSLNSKEFEKFRKNEKIGKRNAYYGYDFPKTRRLIFENSIKINGKKIDDEIPLGWAKLRISD